MLSDAAWQRCYVHFLRNALDYRPRRANDDCLQELRWIYDRGELAEVRRDLAAWPTKWSGKHARLCTWAEENIEETLTYYRLPLAHYKHVKSISMLERLNQEIKRRVHVVRIFPNTRSCLRLVRAVAVETHEDWLESLRYLNMEHLREHKAAHASGGMTVVPTYPRMASCSPPSSTLRAGFAGGLQLGHPAKRVHRPLPTEGRYPPRRAVKHLVAERSWPPVA